MTTIINEMNNLARQQEELGKRIIQLLTNAKKDTQSRKTEAYISSRLATLEEIWNEVKENQSKITTLDVQQHPYFETNYYKQIQEKYEETKNYLEKCPKAPLHQKTTTSVEDQKEQAVPIQYQQKKNISTEASLQEIEQLQRLKKQAVRIKQLNQTTEVTDQELQESKSKIRYELLLQKIEKQWEAIQELHEEIMVYETNYQSNYFQNNEYLAAEQSYETTMENLRQKINTSQNNAEITKPNLKLPNIEIPIFDGNYDNWPTFNDIFLKVIHGNPSLTNIEKMQYLKTHIQGQPSRMVQHLQITDANYEVVWELLQKRYENRRLLVSKLIDKIMDIPPIQNESMEKLRQLHDVITECLKAVNNLGVDTTSWGPIITRIITRKWDQETNRLYEQSLEAPHEIQEYQDLMEFLNRRFQSLESITMARKTTYTEMHQTPTFRNYNPNVQSTFYSPNYCNYCKLQHNIYECPKFKALSINDRTQFIKDRRLCFNCLNHDVKKWCRSRKRCYHCDQQHHSLLHKERQINPKPYNGGHFNTTTKYSTHASEKRSLNSQQRTTPVTSHLGRQDQTILLATALVQVKAATGTMEYLRVLIDPGSQSSFMTERAAQSLGIPRQKIKAEITGLGAGDPKVSTTKIQAEVHPRFPSNFMISVNFLVLSKLTQTLPTSEIEYTSSNQLQNHILADPTYNKPGPIDAILGAEEFGKIILQGLTKSEDGLLAQQTELGWILSGNAKEIQQDSIKIISMISRTEEDKQLTKFWELEEVSMKKIMSPDDAACEEHYTKTTNRNLDGTYTVQIPFKEDSDTKLGNSKSRAIARLLQLEKRLQKDNNLANQYQTFMQEYLNLGHMKKVPHHLLDEGKYYIPHQPIIKESSTTTKLRVVFDASSKTSNGVSLNELMYAGPRLQQELSDILLRWRKHQVAFSADIEKMYRQIKISEEDQKFHRILWRFDQFAPIQEFCLTTVTYGTTSAPFLAIRTLQQLAEDQKEAYPQASEIIMKDFYVDDVLSGADNIEEAVQLQSELTSLLKSGGFTLRKWSSNKPQLLQAVPEELKDQISLEITEDKTKKSLGIHWAPIEDNLCFKLKTTNHQIISKRTILSQIAKLFDPLGCLAPVIITAKLLVQELWLEELEWDQPVPENIKAKWICFNDQLKVIEEISIPRWIKYSNTMNIQLHGFCDASEKAYGAVIYARTIDSTGEVSTTLLTAKSKVAPARTKTTIPRLELCAAVLLAKLMKRTITALNIQKTSVFAWTDSMIVLAWINGDASRWKTFIANRVAEINDLVPFQSWQHVPTEENPADIISRGINPTKLKNCVLWWNGPKWLIHQTQWPKQVQTFQTKEEIKLCHHVAVNCQDNPIIKKFSSLTRMVRVLSYCKRFIDHTRKLPKQTGLLSVQEIDATLLQLVKQSQQEQMPREIKTLQVKKSLEKNSNILNLDPFIDNDGILRVGGRLRNSSLPYEQKHPIILPCHSHLSQLIVKDAHLHTLHGRNQTTLAYVRRKFWIINGKITVRSIINKCITCIRYKAETARQLMGDLPTRRVTPSPPFLHSAVDYAGPIQIKATKGRGYKSYKGYIAIFVCLSTKAIHLEVVSDMTTDAFLAAFRRFTARRGRCAHMYSDNGTNFIGASKVLEREIKNIISQSDVQDPLATSGTQWHFIPPAAPHFGGLWEAGVKSMKYHLRRIIGNSTLTFEELTTLQHQIEACLNSRPLCTLTNDIDDIEALTPGHFLIGRAIVSPPNPVTNNINTNLSSRWQLVQKMKKDFWHAWSSDYLNKLQQRYKWKTRQDNLKMGDLVLLKEDTINPSRWPLARISETYPATDNTLRVVTVKKSDGKTFKRSIHNIIPLPVSPEDQTATDTKNNDHEVVSTTANHAIKKKPPQKRKPKSISLSLLLMLIGCIFNTHLKPVRANYTLQFPQPGLYVEHIGHARIERGIFRIEIKYSRSKIEEDSTTIADVVKKFQKLCDETQSLSDETQCTALTHHLIEQEHQMQWIKNSMNGIIHNRSKRKLLGQFLNYVFGVNDEVYKDINSLQQNQQELIRASNHQTKFMITALSTFNDTETRINNQLERFRTKLNEGLEVINKMQAWFRATDINKLNIHLLSTYQIATNFISELCNYYTRIVDVHLNRGSLYDLITPAHVHNIIKEANSKLPKNLDVISSSIIRMSVNHDESYIHVLGHFPIADRTDFVMMKITPTPLKIENGSYWILDIPNEIIAVDYNTQLYFQLSDEEFKNRITTRRNNYLCAPSVVKNIETNPNCIIDEIYQRSEPTKCKIRKNSIYTIVWKQLCMVNTWMFIVSKPIKIAVTCSGMREDVLLNTTGVIQITEDCIIQTKLNILTPKRVETISVLSSYTKAIPLPRNLTLEHHTYKDIQEEPVFKNSDKLSNLRDKENDIQQELKETIWHTTKQHSITTSSITTATVLGTAILVWGIYQFLKRRSCHKSSKQTDQPTQSTPPPEMIELQPLR